MQPESARSNLSAVLVVSTTGWRETEVISHRLVQNPLSGVCRTHDQRAPEDADVTRWNTFRGNFHENRSFIGHDRLLMDIPCASAFERPPVAKSASGGPKTFSCTHYESVLSKANMHRHFTGAKHELLSSTATQSVVVSTGNAVMHGGKSFK